LFFIAISKGRAKADIALIGVDIAVILVLGLAFISAAIYEATDEAVEVPRQSDRLIEELLDRDK